MRICRFDLLLNRLTIEVDDRAEARNWADRINQWMNAGKTVNVSFAVERKPRSTDANALLWACIGEIAQELRRDKWDIYLELLKRYTKGTYVICKKHAVEAFKRSWRECEEVGEIEVNGQEAIQLLCYPGSSTLDTKEFSVLLDGTIDEMKEMGLPTPSDRRLAEIVGAHRG